MLEAVDGRLAVAGSFSSSGHGNAGLMEEAHDVVIVGAGPGGEAIARRLAGHGIATRLARRAVN